MKQHPRFALLVFLASVSTASAADLNLSPRPTPAQLSAPVFDAFVALSAGYSWGHDTVLDTDNDGPRVQGRGSFSYMFTPTYGFQGDGSFGRDWAEVEFDDGDKIEAPSTDVTLASHLFWRDPQVGAVGLLAQYTGLKTRYDFGGGGPWVESDNYLLGLEGQYFLGNASLYGQIAYHYADGSIFGTAADGGGVAAVVQARYFVSRDWLIALKGGYDRVGLDLGGQDLDQTTWLAGLRTDYKLAGSPFSFFGDLTYSDVKYDFDGLDSYSDRETRMMVGFKYNFSTPTLIERDRTGASFDPIELRGRFVPGV